MKALLFFISTFILSTVAFSQNDTINQIDVNGRKQGHWIYYGKDRPELGYPSEGKVEEGSYKDDRKQGIWTKYHNDGRTPKLKGEYRNNRPSGRYWKINSEGWVMEKGRFRGMHYKGLDTTFRFNKFQRLTNYSIYNGRNLILDSTFYYLSSGCLDSIVVSKVRDSSISTLKFSRSICDSLLSTSKRRYSYYRYEVDSISGRIIERSVCDWGMKDKQMTYRRGQVYDWEGNPIVPNIPDEDVSESSIQPIYEIDRESFEKDHIYLREIHDLEGEKQEFKYLIKFKNVPKKVNGYNKIYNENFDIFLDGDFRNYRLWDGKVYEYDEDGILLRVKVYKNGKYHSDGQL